MKLEEYPLLFRQSDSRAIANQKWHFRFLKMKIALLLAIAAFASLSWASGFGLEFWTGFSIALILAVLMTLTAIGDLKRYSRTWFSARAVAESVKKESWLFMMKTPPYNDSTSDIKAKRLFLDRLQEFLDSEPSICSELTMNTPEGKQITEAMENVRGQSVPERLSYYCANRILDEKQWYTGKAAWNQKQWTGWFILSWTMQGLAVILAFTILIPKASIINPVGIVTTAGAGVLSWMGARNHRELSQSYGFVAQRLSILEEQAHQTSDEKELAEIVSHVEETISQEHTIWIVRRLDAP
jgi:hypothetical protein